MAKVWSTSSYENNLKSTIVIAIVAVCVIGVAIWTLSTGWALPATLTNEQQIRPDYTLSYAIISPEDAQELISANHDLVIADVRGCDCDYDEGHIPDAIWQVNPTLFYNTTSDILVYCQDGLSCVTFCKDLLNHTYGEIYALEGGINAWKNAGYRVTEL